MIAVAVLLQLAAAPDTALLPLDAPERIPGRVAALCPTEAAMSPAALARADSMTPPIDPARWYAAACLRASRYVADFAPTAIDRAALARRRDAQQRTVEVLQGALRRDAGDARAAEFLAVLAPALGEGQTSGYAHPATLRPMEGLAPLLLAAVRRGVRTPIVLRVCASLHLSLRDAAVARECGDLALRGGHDAAWHHLRASWMAFCLGDTATMLAAFAAAERTADGPGIRREIASILSPPKTGAELAARRIDADTTPVARLGRGMARHRPAGTTLGRLAEGFTATIDVCAPPSVPGLDRIALDARLLRLWDPVDRTPLTLVGYAWRAEDVATDGGAVALELSTWSAAERRASARTWPASDARAVLTVRGGDGIGSWTLTARQDGVRLGRVARDGEAGLARGPLMLSDVVVEDTLDGTDVVLGEERLRVAPTATLSRDRTAPVAWQVFADRPLPGSWTTVTVHRLREGRRDPRAALSVRFASPVGGGLAFVRRTLDLSRLDAGAHDLEIVVHDATVGLRAARSTRIVLR